MSSSSAELPAVLAERARRVMEESRHRANTVTTALRTFIRSLTPKALPEFPSTQSLFRIRVYPRSSAVSFLLRSATLPSWQSASSRAPQTPWPGKCLRVAAGRARGHSPSLLQLLFRRQPKGTALSAWSARGLSHSSSRCDRPHVRAHRQLSTDRPLYARNPHVFH